MDSRISMIQDYGFKIQDVPDTMNNEQLAMSNEQFPQKTILRKIRFGEIVHCTLLIVHCIGEFLNQKTLLQTALSSFFQTLYGFGNANNEKGKESLDNVEYHII